MFVTKQKDYTAMVYSRNITELLSTVKHNTHIENSNFQNSISKSSHIVQFQTEEGALRPYVGFDYPRIGRL